MSRSSGSLATIGVDLSTTSAKALVRRLDGKLLASASVAYPSQYLPGSRVEQDAEDWWRSVSSVIREVVAKSRSKTRIVAVCVTTQGITIVPTDRDYHPLRTALTWLDFRAQSETADLEQAFGMVSMFRRTGRRPHPAFSLPKLAWLRRHEPELFERASAWLTPLGFLNARLTGTPTIDHTQAAGTLLYDLSAGDWSAELMNWGRIARCTLPAIAWAGTDLGVMLPEIAADLGLPADVRVVLGAQDQKCAAYAAGIGAGVATVSLGTAAAISGLLTAIPADSECLVPISPFLRPNEWVLEAVVPAAASSLEWLARMIGAAAKKRVPVSRLIELAESSPKGANGTRFVPHLAGSGTPAWDPDARGSFLGLTLATTACDLARSVLEGVATEIANSVRTLESLGLTVNELRLIGGGAKSSLWRHIIEENAGIPTSVLEQPEAAAVGAAMLAAGLEES